MKRESSAVSYQLFAGAYRNQLAWIFKPVGEQLHLLVLVPVQPLSKEMIFSTSAGHTEMLIRLEKSMIYYYYLLLLLLSPYYGFFQDERKNVGHR